MISFFLSPMGILFFGGSLLMGAVLLHTHGKEGKKRKEERLSSNSREHDPLDSREEKLNRLENLLVQKEESLQKLILTAAQTTEQLDRMIRRFEDTFYAKDSKSPSVSMIFGDLRSSLNNEVSDLRNQLKKGSSSRESRIMQREKAA